MNDVVKVLSLVTIIFISQFMPIVEYNEMDVIPYGYALFNPDWLSSDWYLNLEILYRFPFGYISGFFVALFGFIPTIFYGRIISYIFFSYACLSLIKTTKTNFVLGCVWLMVFLTFFPNGMYSGEWIIGGLETKVFAYSFALLALRAALEKKYGPTFLYSGISLSLHLLIGGYHLMCLFAVLRLQAALDSQVIRDMLNKSYLFLIGGFWGIIGISSYLFNPVSQEISKLAWDVYVQVRVPYHVLPKLYFEALVVPFLFSFFNLVTVFYIKKEELKYLSSYILVATAISGLGVLIYWFGDQALLRYYFFRFNDAIQPLLTILILASLGTDKLEQLGRILKIPERLNVRLPAILLLGITVFFVIKKVPNIQKLMSTDSYKISEIQKRSSVDFEMSEWINSNTPATSVFIVPIDWETFYMEAERPLFVSWKHAPQRAHDLVEWYKRIQLLNKGEDLMSKNIDHRKVVARNYKKLTDVEIVNIKEQYPEVSHVILPSEISLEFEEIFRTTNFILYKL